MKFTINEIEYEFPFSLRNITLGQRVSFYQTYGKELDQRAAEIDAMPAGFEKETASAQWHLDNAIKTFCHYSGVPLETGMNEVLLSDVMMIYNIDIQLLQEQERDIALPSDYCYVNCNEHFPEAWVISPPELKPDNLMTLNEFLCAKEITRQLHALGMGKWDALPYLCAIYLRKEGEAFDESFINEGSRGRTSQMLQLPLDVALGVGFFLSATASIYLSTFRSLNPGLKAALTQPATSKDGAGSASSAISRKRRRS